MNQITTFRDTYRFLRDTHRFLSNFYQYPFTYKGLVYPNAEAAFQAQKCSSDADRIKYTLQKSPVEAERMGKKEHYNKNVVYFSLEMYEKQLYVNYNIQGKSSIRIIDDCWLTVSQMKEKLQNLGNVDLVIIDYLGLIKSESEHKKRLACLFDIGRELHDLSQERKIPVLFLCQLPRNIDYRTDQRPSMQDFRNWIGLEQLVDIEMLLYRNSYPKCGEPFYYHYYHFDPIIECNIAKNKYGETEIIPLNCRLDFKVLQSNNEV